MSPKREARIKKETARMEAEMLALRELRQSLGITQKELADAMDANQSDISLLEQRSDYKISTVRRVVKALGGELEIVAKFNGKNVRLSV